ncbi:MAG: choice-of-anchor D domain-containing protein, partial [Bdellovibrionales bacterium]|nr:choice-of-anchor D domain-containing protein [Bdellovibrionales bacterium]
MIWGTDDNKTRGALVDQLSFMQNLLGISLARGLRAQWGALLSVLVLLSSCEGIGNKEIADKGSLGISLVSNSGCDQFAEPGQKFTYPIVIKAVDPLGDPVPNIEVELSVDDSVGATILTPKSTSDSTGSVASNVLAPNVLNKKFAIYANIAGSKIKVGCNLATYPEQLLIISDGPTYNFETEAVGSTRTYNFVLNNTGTTSATAIFGQVKDLPFSFKGGSYPGAGGTCGTTLAGGANCTIVVDFAPTAVSFFTGSVEVNYKDGDIDRLAVRNLQGTGANLGKLEISEDPSYNFGSVVVGSSADHTFTVNNIGTLPVSSITSSGLTGAFNYKDGSYPGTGGTCTTSLAAGGSCTVVLSFRPLLPGLLLDKIDLSYANGVSTDRAERDVQGVGATPALLEISDSPSYDFGVQAVNSTTDHTFTVSNNGNSPALSMGHPGLLAPYEFKGNLYPGTGGTCGTSLNASSTCTIVVSYTPTTTGLHNGVVRVNYNDGAISQQATRNVQGTGADLGYLEISAGPQYDYGSKPLGSVTDYTFTVTNTGTGSVSSATGTGLLAPFRFKTTGTYPGAGGTCGATFTPGQSCTIVVSFSPTAAGVFYDTIQIDYNDGSNSRNALRDVKGTGVSAAQLTISNTPLYDFGTKALGSTSEYTFTVDNTGAVTASGITGGGLAAPFAFKGGSYPGTGGNCSASLAASASCSIVVTFAPTSSAIFTDTIQLDYNDGAISQQATRDVLGQGTNQAVLTISDDPLYDYGTLALGATGEHAFTINNTGGISATAIAPVALAAPFAFKGGSYPGTGGNCGATLVAAGTCSIVVTYAPTATGVHTATLRLDYNDGSAPQNVTRNLQGTGADAANLVISDGPTYDYGLKAVSTQTDKTFNVSNAGGLGATAMSGLALPAPFSYKGGSYPGTGGNCGATLPAAANCTIVVSYTPTTTGVHSATIQISYNDGTAPKIATRDVTGTGATVALLSLSDGPTYDYGTQAIGSNNDKIFTMNNLGGLPATLLLDLGLTAPFQFKGGSYPGTGGTCSASLSAGATCVIVVTYSPTTPGIHTDTIRISYNDGLVSQTVTRAVQGTGASSALLTISDGPSYNYGNRAIGSSTDKIFAVNNSGSITATAMAGTGLAAPFTFKGGSYPGTGGNCGVTLAAAGTCNIVVTYAPTTTGAHSDTIDLTYSDGVGSATASRDVTGTGTTAAQLTISDAPTYDFGTQALGASVDKSFTVNNTGGTDATTMSGAALVLPFSYKGGTYPGTGGTCGATLAAGANCSVVVNYAPTSAGVHSGTLTLNYNDGVTAQSSARPMQGTGAVAAFLSISDGATFDFGTQALGATAEHSFTVTNTGGLSATGIAGSGLALPFAFKGGSYPGTGGTCSASLAAAGTCTMIVTFAPTVTGIQTDTINLDYNNGLIAATASRDVQGTGASAATLTISDGPTYNYGTLAVSASADHTFIVNNTGGMTASAVSGTGLAAPFTFKGGTYPGTGGSCGASLVGGTSCTLVVTYNPSTTGVHNDTLVMNYNNGITGTSTSVDVQGTGAATALLAISDAPLYDFGGLAIGASATYTLTVSNTGGVAATSVVGTGLAPPFSYNGGSYPGTGGTCGATLNSSANCTIVVKYNPTAVGIHTDTIQIDYDSGSGLQSATRDLQGTGLSAALLSISDGPTYDFGPKAVGSVSEKSFTVTNTGDMTATTMAGAAFSAPFAYKGGTYPGTGGNCGASLANAATCTIVVTYSPTANGPHSATLQVSYNNGVSGQTALRAIQGTGADPANLTLSDGPSYDFGIRSVGSSVDHTFTVSNIGGVPATAVIPTALNSPFSFKGGLFPGTGGTCGGTINNSSTCTIVVSFAPVIVNTFSDTLRLDYNNGMGSQNVTRAMTGEGATLGFLLISDGPTFDYGTQATGSATDHTFTVQNTGGMTVSAISPAAIGAPFGYKGSSYPGTGGSCGASLASAASCTIVVTYNPSFPGVHTGTIRLDYNDGVNSAFSTRDVTGTAASPAVLSISNGPTYDYGTIAVGSSVDFTFTVNNTGGVPATGVSGLGLAAPFSFKGGSYPGTGGNCGTAIAPSTSCNLVVTFAPTVTGFFTDSIQMDYNNGTANTNALRPVQGTATSPALLTITDAPLYDFGSRAIGSNTQHTFTVTNIGGVPATTVAGTGLAAPFTFLGGSYPGVGGTCTSLINNGTACTVVVNFSPIAPGLQVDTMDINYHNGVASQTVSRDMQGMASSSALLVVSNGPTYDFGAKAVGSSTDFTFTIDNTGDVAATTVAGSGLAAPFTFKGGSYPGTGGTCGTLVNPVSSCTIVVTYAPTTTGAHADTIVIDYFDGVLNKSATRDITGTGADPALLTISGAPLVDFGNVAVGGTVSQILSVSNTGGVGSTGMAGAGLAAPFSFKGGSYPGTGGTCGASLAAGASCNIEVAYAPAATGTHTDTIDLSYNNGVNAQTA